jgi:hypothetical protein
MNPKKKITGGETLNEITRKKVTIKAHVTEKMNQLIQKLESPH